MKISLSTFAEHIVINHARCFQHYGVNETGLSDFHKLVLKMFYTKQKPKIKKYRNYKNFSSITFRINLLKKLSLSKFQKGDFDKF